ncbi:outer membrane protein assembly factor BamB [Thioalkalivibrio sp. XN8]|uniref:outer membrane protein assembly factor BamB n=1 Tax=Thioalkalivibrio sp. XN8 TaxID=2712863 RepID=UPI0013EC5999|nr:outer membrane protein assembly factor BamB [Thioalkalivibrio sp. XN8]
MTLRPGIALGCLALLSLGGCGIFGGDDEPIEPPAELVEFEATLEVREAWEFRAGSGAERLGLALRPAVEGGRVYVAGRDGRVHALDLESGDRLWTTETDVALAAGPAAGFGLVAVGGSDGMVIALDAGDGSVRWQAQLSGEVLASPAVTAQAVVVRSVDGYLRALAPDTGEEIWAAEQRPPRLTLRGTGAPATGGGLVVSGFDNGRVAAYDLRDGEQRWEQTIAIGRGRTEIERLADVDATPQIVPPDVFAVGYQGRVVSLSLETGQLLWANEMSSHKGLGVDWTSLYVTTDESEVVGMSRASGGELWRQDALRLRRLTAPTPHGQSVVVGDFEGWLHWLDPISGRLQARHRAGDASFITAPVSGGELLIAQDEEDRVYALRTEPRG